MLKNKKGVVTEIQHDEHLRPETTLEQLHQVKSAVSSANGVITAGNASGVNDGAAALIIASEQMAAARTDTAGAYRSHGNRRGGTAPDGAWSGACNSPGAGTRRAGIHDMDVIELNEALRGRGVRVYYANWGCLMMPHMLTPTEALSP